MPQTLILDSSQISSFLECQEKWNLSYIENLTRSVLIDDPIAAGTLMHKYLEIYYKSIGYGHTPLNAYKIAAAFNPDLEDKADAGQYPLGTDLRKRVLGRFTDYVTVYTAKKDYEVAKKKVYDIKFSPDGLPVDSTKEEPLVEQGFSYELLNTNEYLFVLEGRIDLLAVLGSEHVWVDHKLQFRERELYSKSIQFRNYSLATGLNLGVINYIRLHQSVNDKTLVRQPISFSSLENRLWKQELIEIFISISKSLTNGAGFRKNRESCSGKFGYPCPFTPICEEWSGETREAIKQRDFVQKKEWKPWQ
jgi:hypothetical protein